MSHPSRQFWTRTLSALAIIGLLSGVLVPIMRLNIAQAASKPGQDTPPYVRGPFTGPSVKPTVFNGDLRNLPQTKLTPHEMPEPKSTNNGEANSSETWVDPVVQQQAGQGKMPEPIRNFAGLDFSTFGAGWPPDTNGDVGPTYYIETVNTSLGIYDKVTGTRVVGLTYDDFFVGPVGTPCDEQNAGDVVVLYDAQVDRWVITDFAWTSYPDGPFFECIAVSQTNDPVVGGWYFYAMPADDGSMPNALNDYPKLGVWSDGWYMSANMFGDFFAVRVWALDRASAINGGDLHQIFFDCTGANSCESLLPANYRGSQPPAGSPEYFANVLPPNSFNLWQFHVDWETPQNSTFTGPTLVHVAMFQEGSMVPQLGSSELLDSLGDRMMMQLQYRNYDGAEALFATHTVKTGGVDAIRWYEVRDPAGTPSLFQQGTFQPDNNYRWMGSIAADGEGNIAVGYSVSSSSMYPSIRYAGRLAGETPGLLTQGEASLVEGTGAQQGGYNRWGDYSAMTIDPVDDCTFWYVQEYYTYTGNNWQTRIGAFKFPSCGQSKGTVSGYVRNAETNQPIANAPVLASGMSYTFSTSANETGFYSIDLIGGNYDLTAGPLLPGYPGTTTVSVDVTAGQTTQQDILLDPSPSLVHDALSVSDPSGNNNGFPEPGEHGLELLESLYNQGATTSSMITAKVTSLTEGVTIQTADTTYADIPAGSSGQNATPYTFSIDQNLTCGTDMNFQAVVTDSVHTYNTAFSLNASTPLPRVDIFFNDVEGGDAGWTTGGSPNTWAITDESAHSGTHSWTDSPGEDYHPNANNYVRTPAYDLTGMTNVELSGWFKYALETGYDIVKVEYSLNGGTNWDPIPLIQFTGFEDWHEVFIDASVLDNQANVALRFRLDSDPGINADGIYMDDIKLTYEPFECTYTPVPEAPTLIAPANGSWSSSPVTFVWQPAGSGSPAEGYVLYIDGAAVATFDTPVTTTTLDVASWSHTWYVEATNASGSSLPSETWNLNVYGKFFLPLTNR